MSGDRKCMEEEIFNKISEQYNIEIKSGRFKRDVPALLSKDMKIFYINEKYSLESQVYSIFHTLAHIQLGTKCSNSTAREEKAAVILTLELLIPKDEIVQYSFDKLLKLKDTFPYCSYETIAMRLLSLKSGILTIWYEYELKSRRSFSEQKISEKPDSFEDECMLYSYKHQCSIGRANENKGLRCFSYFIKEDSRKKVILSTERI